MIVSGMPTTSIRARVSRYLKIRGDDVQGVKEGFTLSLGQLIGRFNLHTGRPRAQGRCGLPEPVDTPPHARHATSEPPAAHESATTCTDIITNTPCTRVVSHPPKDNIAHRVHRHRVSQDRVRVVHGARLRLLRKCACIRGASRHDPHPMPVQVEWVLEDWIRFGGVPIMHVW